MSNSSPTAPLTAVLFCYRQEEVVADAVRALFNQRQQPAEIILSDDASPDGSHEVLKALATEYDGPAKVIVRRSERNEGWFAHINACLNLASHDHILVFAGDDISRPERVGTFAEAIRSKPEAKLIWSRMERMTPDGEATGKIMGVTSFSPGKLRGGVGASQCWHKQLLGEFDELPEVQAAEDIILPFRAWLMGGLHFLPEPLVLWRDRDYRELSREQLDWTYELRQSEFRINAAQVIRDDLKGFLAQHPDQAQRLAPVQARLKRETRSVTAEYEVIRAPGRLASLCKLLPLIGSIGFKRSRRLWQDQVLGLPAYLESAYSRRVKRWAPRLIGLACAAIIGSLLNISLPLRLSLALISIPMVFATTRTIMRLVARMLWKPN